MMMYMLIGLALAMIVVLPLMLKRDPQGEARARLKRMQKRRDSAPHKNDAGGDALSLRRKQMNDNSPVLMRLMAWLPNLESLQNRLIRAGSLMSARQFLFRSILVMFLCAAAMGFYFHQTLVGLCIGFILGFWFPLKVINFKINRQKKIFLRLFPDGIDLIVRGLRSGLPVSESIKLVADEVPEPVSSTFAHVANTVKLGVPLEKALQEVAMKLNYTEFNFFVTSIVLQRETGGNLGEILNNLSEVLRKRYLMQMKIKAMSSEARASAMIIGALPFLVIGAVSVMTPDYIKVLFTDYRGNIAGLIAAGMLTMGIMTMQRMAKFEI